MPLHPAWVKNISRRVLWGALEKDITKKDRRAMEEFFAHRCAYCEDALGTRWHADHLVSVDAGGFNHASNRVPTCARCNEREKREMDWLRFLEQKTAGSAHLLRQRRARIEEWMRRFGSPEPPVSEAQRRAWQRETAAVAAAIDAAWRRLRAMRAG